MNLIQMISPTHPPAHIKALGEVAVNRERILQTLLVVIFLASVIGYFGLAVYTLPRQQYGQFILYSGLLILIFVFTAYRKLAYTTRSLLILAFHTGNGDLYLCHNRFGRQRRALPAGIYCADHCFAWLESGSNFTPLLPSGLFSFMASCSFKIVMVYPQVCDGLAKNGISEWVQTGVFLSVVSSTITFSLGMLIRGLESLIQPR